jgi:hypothetical protein
MGFCHSNIRFIQITDLTLQKRKRFDEKYNQFFDIVAKD